MLPPEYRYIAAWYRKRNWDLDCTIPRRCDLIWITICSIRSSLYDRELFSFIEESLRPKSLVLCSMWSSAINVPDLPTPAEQ